MFAGWFFSYQHGSMLGLSCLHSLFLVAVKTTGAAIGCSSTIPIDSCRVIDDVCCLFCIVLSLIDYLVDSIVGCYIGFIDRLV